MEAGWGERREDDMGERQDVNGREGGGMWREVVRRKGEEGGGWGREAGGEGACRKGREVGTRKGRRGGVSTRPTGTRGKHE